MDVAQSRLYCFSFAPNFRCRGAFPSRDEIFGYLKDTAAQWELEKYVRFNSVVTSTDWNHEKNCWSVYVQSSEYPDRPVYRINTIFLVSATGQLNVPNIPDLPGLDTFEGRVVHTAEWDPKEEEKSIDSKNVAVIGNGASGVQIIPNISHRSKTLTLFQRSPAWIIPKQDARLSFLERILHDFFPIVRQYARARIIAAQDAFHAFIVDGEGGE